MVAPEMMCCSARLGNDSLFGGGATVDDGNSDYLFGGAGADLFGVQDLPGVIMIQDFSRAEGDVISVQGTAFTSFAQVLDVTTNSGNFCVVTIDSDTSVWIIGQTSATLQSTDFAFS